MRDIEELISPFIEKQFPSFYNDEGPLFLLFTKEYFKWMESNNVIVNNTDVSGQTIYHLRKLLTYGDVDSTIDEFLVYLKDKYARGIDFNTASNKRLLIKAARDLYQAKGTERSFDLLFRLVFGTSINVYYPGDDTLKPSDGTWVVPKYLELTRSAKSPGLVGKQVTGSKSGASAFIEYLITRNINGNIIDIAYLSNLEGNFLKNDIITNDGIIEGSPKIVGSLSTIDLTTSGYGFEVGETVHVFSARGVEGKARVVDVVSETGKVSFSIIDGGWGYSNTANTFVSTKVISYNNLTNSNNLITSFERSELVTETLYNLVCNNVTGDIISGELIINGDSNTATIANITHTVGSNTAVIYVNPLSGNILSNNTLRVANQAFITTNTNIAFSVGQSVTQYNGTSTGTVGKITSVNTAVVLSINAIPSMSANGMHVGTYVVQATSGARGTIKAVERESNFGFSNVRFVVLTSTTGTFDNNYSITVYSDSSMATTLTTATPNTSTNAYLYELGNVSIGSAAWSTSNTIALTGTPTTNNLILVASDFGGLVNNYTNITATGVLMGPNTTSNTFGVRSVNNTFYATGNTIVFGQSSNTYANIYYISTGENASFKVGLVNDAETVLLATDRISSNNDGPGSNSVKYSTMLITGANSGYGNLSSVYIFSGGTSYDNTNIVTFTGGFSGGGSFGAGNATITTNSSGGISAITLTSNVGNLYITTPTVAIVNATGGSSGVGTNANVTPLFHYGFPKLIMGDASYILKDLLNFESKTIGTIASLTSINPGENYNVDPFVLAYESGVASLGKYDYVLELSNLTTYSPLLVGETVEQTITVSAMQTVSNTFNGNTSLNYEVGELVYQDNGIANTASGELYSSSLTSPDYTNKIINITGTLNVSENASIITVSSNTNFTPGDTIGQGGATPASGTLKISNTTTLVVNNVTGTFQSNATNITSTSGGSQPATAVVNKYIYTLKGATSKGNTIVISVSSNDAITTSKGVFRGWEQIGSNSTHYIYRANVSRRSIFTDIVPSATNKLIGVTSGSNVVVLSVSTSGQLALGDNSILLGNVVTSNGSIKSIKVVDSGFGYVQDETANLVSEDGGRVATGKLNIINEGTGEGYYSTTNGFLDNNKYIHDGEYYQEYSYEVRGTIPLDNYSSILKQVVHVAGTRLFGRITKTSDLELTNLDADSYITIS